MNIVIGLGEEIKESVVVQKLLRSLPPGYNPKVYDIEEITNWETLTRNQLLGNLTSYEMRLQKGNSNMREASFKEKRCIEEKGGTCSCSNEEEAKFVRRLDIGIGKYKGKIPFKCFNCGRVGHYASKCTHKKIENQSKGKEKRNFRNR